MSRLLLQPMLLVMLAVIAILSPWPAQAQVPRTVVTEVFGTTT